MNESLLRKMLTLQTMTVRRGSKVHSMTLTRRDATSLTKAELIEGLRVLEGDRGLTQPELLVFELATGKYLPWADVAVGMPVRLYFFEMGSGSTPTTTESEARALERELTTAAHEAAQGTRANSLRRSEERLMLNQHAADDAELSASIRRFHLKASGDNCLCKAICEPWLLRLRATYGLAELVELEAAAAKARQWVELQARAVDNARGK